MRGLAVRAGTSDVVRHVQHPPLTRITSERIELWEERNISYASLQASWLLVMEFFGWREFKNRREVGGLAGFTPTPYQSGESAREQGISKSGNRHVRWMTTELAWSWLRYQPESALSVWFRERFGSGGKRLRRIGMVAVARKLLIALWRFLETGVLPEGAILKEG